MAAISYTLVDGGVLENVVAGTNAPSAGVIELRFDQTATTVTDGNAPGAQRALKRGEIQTLIRILEQYVLRDTNVSQ